MTKITSQDFLEAASLNRLLNYIVLKSQRVYKFTRFQVEKQIPDAPYSVIFYFLPIAFYKLSIFGVAIKNKQTKLLKMAIVLM